MSIRDYGESGETHDEQEWRDTQMRERDEDIQRKGE